MLGLEALKSQPSAQVDRFVREQSAMIPVLKARMQHAGLVTALEFSADGKLLISASEDKTLRVWNAATGAELASARHASAVSQLRYDPVGGYIATLARGGTSDKKETEPDRLSQITLWRLEGTSLTGPLYRADTRGNMAFGDGKLWLADGTSLSSLRLDSIKSGLQSIELNAPQLAFAPGGKFLVFVDGRIVRARNLATGVTNSFEFPEPLVSNTTLSFLVSQDSQYVGLTGLVKQSDSTVPYRFHQWKLDPPARIGAGLSADPSDDGALSAGGQFLAAVGSGSSASVLDAATGLLVGEMDEAERDSSNRFWNIVNFSHDNNRVALAVGRGALRIFDLVPWKEVFRIGLDQTVARFAWHPDDRTVAVGTETGLVSVWSVGDDDGIAKIAALSRTYSPSGRYFVAMPDRSHFVLGDSDNRVLRSFESEGGRLQFSADERRFAWIDRERRKVSLYALPQNQPVCSFDYPARYAEIGFRRSDAFLMVTEDGYLRRWSADNCELGRSLFLGEFEKDESGDPAGSWQVDFSPRGAIVAIALGSGADNKTLWDVDAEKPLGTVQVDGFSSLVFSPDETLVSGRTDEGLTVWRTAAAQKLWVEKDDDRRWDWKFDPSGRKLAGSAGNVMRVWDSSTGRKLLEDNDETAVSHGVSFDRSGDFLASSWSGRVKIWDIGAGAQISDIPTKTTGGSRLMEFSPDGSRLIIGASDGAVRAFWWRTLDVIREGCRRVAFNLSPADWRRLGGYYTPTEPTCPGVPVHQ